MNLNGADQQNALRVTLPPRERHLNAPQALAPVFGLGFTVDLDYLSANAEDS